MNIYKQHTLWHTIHDTLFFCATTISKSYRSFSPSLTRKNYLLYFKKNAPMLIATSTGLYDGFADYRMPFYDAFRVFHIPELEHEDLADILPKKEYEAVKKDEFFSLRKS